MTITLIICALFVGGATGWFVGALITGLIYINDAPINHKICWAICGIGFGLFTIMCLFFDNIIM